MSALTLAAIAIGGYLIGRHRTAKLEPLTTSDVEDAGLGFCEQLAVTDNPASWSPRVFAEKLGAYLRPDVSWPPPFLAESSHVRAWAGLLSWAESLFAEAADNAYSNPCVYLTEVLFPLIPDDPEEPMDGPVVLVPVPGNTTPNPGGGPPLLGDPDGPVPTKPTTLAPIIADTPTPGRWYQVGSDSSVPSSWLGHVGRAYGLSAGTSARLAAAVDAAAHPNNLDHAEMATCGEDVQCTGGGAPYAPSGGRVPSMVPGNVVFFPEL